MALALGTNAGFVTTAPTANPGEGGQSIIDTKATAMKAKTEFGFNYIVREIGYYLDGASEAADLEIGIYEDSSGAPGALLYSQTGLTKRTTEGWDVFGGLNWVLSQSTNYWIAIQIDDTATSTRIQRELNNGLGTDFRTVAALPDPFGGGAVAEATSVQSIYALVERTPISGTKGTRIIATRWPVESGLTAGTTKQEGRVSNLVVQGHNGDISKVLDRNKELI